MKILKSFCFSFIPPLNLACVSILFPKVADICRVVQLFIIHFKVTGNFFRYSSFNHSNVCFSRSSILFLVESV